MGRSSAAFREGELEPFPSRGAGSISTSDIGRIISECRLVASVRDIDSEILLQRFAAGDPVLAEK
jgi:hypothetical protein